MGKCTRKHFRTFPCWVVLSLLVEIVSSARSGYLARLLIILKEKSVVTLDFFLPKNVKIVKEIDPLVEPGGLKNFKLSLTLERLSRIVSRYRQAIRPGDKMAENALRENWYWYATSSREYFGIWNVELWNLSRVFDTTYYEVQIIPVSLSAFLMPLTDLNLAIVEEFYVHLHGLVFEPLPDESRGQTFLQHNS